MATSMVARQILGSIRDPSNVRDDDPNGLGGRSKGLKDH
jgi:hypothetical protein